MDRIVVGGAASSVALTSHVCSLRRCRRYRSSRCGRRERPGSSWCHRVHCAALHLR